MNQSPIPRVLSTFLKHKIKALLIGGQATILYGGADFSRDIDFTVMVSPENITLLKSCLIELNAKRVYVPDISEEVLLRGHACHFRCDGGKTSGFRIDIIGKMRGVDDFLELWKRREEIELPGVGKIYVISLEDLVESKKTQRDKDWSMIRRLIEADYYKSSGNDSKAKLRFWFLECRTPEILIAMALKHKETVAGLCKNRSLLSYAISGEEDSLLKALREEEDKERYLDKQYWSPLKAELETWRHERA